MNDVKEKGENRNAMTKILKTLKGLLAMGREPGEMSFSWLYSCNP
jgi:hypothetical protein